ncbi:MAG TPA: enoyl-CoA hydratase [Xanthobacteraceae bacterium]|nr:enoyl-CoA hydratase [Xanthobacteraceae bacterium]
MNASAPAARITANAPLVERADHDGIALLVLNHPQTRNALSESMIAALTDIFAEIAADRRVRAVVLTANGPAFCAGHDLKEITTHRSDPDGGRAYMRELMARCSSMMQLIHRLPQPVIAAVEGPATAAGCQLVATCDLAVASKTARFATPGVHIGLFCSTPMVALSRNVAPKHAMEMLLTGEMLSADDAYRIGLVNRVVAPGSERDEAMKLARQIAAKSSMTVKLGKEAFYRQLDMSLAEAYRYANEVMVENMMARDAQEGISAFVEKRAPRWEDR